MNIAWRIVRLRWALTMAALKKSVWQTIGYVLGLLAALGCVVGLAFAFHFLGYLPHVLTVPFAGWSAGAELLRSIVVLAGTIAGILWMIMPMTLTGDGSTLGPRRFALYGIADRQLTSGILLSALFGIPALTALTSLLLGASAYRAFGAAAVIAALFSAFVAVLVFVSVSKALIALAGTLVRSKRGQMFLYVFIIALIVVAFQVPSQSLASLGEGNGGFSLSSVVVALSSVATISSWTPWGAAFQMPLDIARGDYLLFAIRLLICLATIIAAFLISEWCLRRDRVLGADSKATVAKGLGWLGRTPDSVAGAVEGRIAQYWQRDGRLTMGLVMPVIIAVIFVIRAQQESAVMWAAPITMGIMYPIFESNNLAYDGKAFTLHALAGVKGSADRWGRARVSAIISMFFVLVTGVVAAAMTGAFAGGLALGIAVVILGGSVGFSLAGIGLAEVLSTVLLYPVASIDKPFSSPQGRAVSQGFFPFIQMLGSVLLVIPTGAVFLVVHLTGSLGLLWLVGLVGVINGCGVLVAGVYLGGRILDQRTPKIVATPDNFASLQK